MGQLTFNVPGIFMLILLYLNNNNQALGSREIGMVFTRHPQPLAAPLDDVVDFECSLNLAPEKFAWHHRPLNSDHWRVINVSNGSVEKTSKFTVNFNEESKAGDYRCIAFIGTRGLASDPGRLSQAKIDEFTDKSNVEIRVHTGNTVPITCPVPNSTPEADVQFYKGNMLIKNASRSGDKTMIIENAKPSDSGDYYCTAENYILGKTYRSNYLTKLHVFHDEKTVKPFFIKQSQTEYKVLKGKNITLECFGAGYPVPKVTWSRLAGSLPPDHRYTSAGLNIINVQPSDRGEYHCAWTSDIGKTESIIILKVVEPPKVIKGPKSATFSEGGQFELSCTVTGTPQPTIEWLINGDTLQPSANVEIKDTQLIVSSVEKKHAGIVQCVASNEYGSHSGFDVLKVSPKQHISDGDRHGMGHGNWGNTNRKRGGGTKKGKDPSRKEPYLQPPFRPNVTRLSDVSVMVRWAVPENTGLPILFFKVQYREMVPPANKKTSKWMTANMEIPSHIRCFEVTDLQPNHTYRFRIAAVYSNDDNKLSQNSVKFHLTKMTDFDPKTMPAPLLTNSEALGPDKVLLTWERVNASFDIDGFYVYHRPSTYAGDYIKTTVEGKNATNITISYLQPDTMYEFKIQSFSVNAASDFSKIIRVKTLKVVTPSPPPIEPILPEIGAQTPSNTHNGTLYAIIGGTLGGVVLLGVFSVIFFVYKRSRIKQSRETSQNDGKSMGNGLVMNGGITDSKINITSNPLAVLDTSDTTMQPKSSQQPSMEMTSFMNGQINTTSNGNDGPAASTPRFNVTRNDTAQPMHPNID